MPFRISLPKGLPLCFRLWVHAGFFFFPFQTVGFNPKGKFKNPAEGRLASAASLKKRYIQLEEEFSNIVFIFDSVAWSNEIQQELKEIYGA